MQDNFVDSAEKLNRYSIEAFLSHLIGYSGVGFEFHGGQAVERKLEGTLPPPDPLRDFGGMGPVGGRSTESTVRRRGEAPTGEEIMDENLFIRLWMPEDLPATFRSLVQFDDECAQHESRSGRGWRRYNGSRINTASGVKSNT